MLHTDYQIEACAELAYTAARLYSYSLGDNSAAPWAGAPAWLKKSVRLGVLGALKGNDAAANHACWLKEKLETGWVYGEVKDVEKKTHPDMVPYEQASFETRMKNQLFVAAVRMMASALDVQIPD